VLATAHEPRTPAQVQAELADGLAYTTVMTALARLYEKGAVTRERTGRGYAYRWADQTTVTARKMRHLLERDDRRASVLARFVAELTPEDGRVLAELLADNPAEPEP
jgi:predicted transcriptional regulator